MSHRTLCLTLTICLAGLLADSRAENVLTLDGQVAPGLQWKSSRTLPRNAVQFITVKRSNGSFGESRRTHFIVRAKVDGDWRLGTVNTYYIPVDRGGGGGASQLIERAKVFGNRKLVTTKAFDFQYLVADQAPQGAIYRWAQIKGPRDGDWTPATYRVPGNAIAAGRHLGRSNNNRPVAPGRLPEEQIFGEVISGNWYVSHESQEERGYIAESEFSDSKFVEFLVSAKVSSAPTKLNIAGRYERRPVENGWHRGEIVATGQNSFEWRNGANRVWKLTAELANNRLQKAPGSDYYELANGKSLTLKLKDGRVHSFMHAGDEFIRVGDR